MHLRYILPSSAPPSRTYFTTIQSQTTSVVIVVLSPPSVSATPSPSSLPTGSDPGSSGWLSSTEPVTPSVTSPIITSTIVSHTTTSTIVVHTITSTILASQSTHSSPATLIGALIGGLIGGLLIFSIIGLFLKQRRKVSPRSTQTTIASRRWNIFNRIFRAQSIAVPAPCCLDDINATTRWVSMNLEENQDQEKQLLLPLQTSPTAIPQLPGAASSNDPDHLSAYHPSTNSRPPSYRTICENSDSVASQSEVLSRQRMVEGPNRDLRHNGASEQLVSPLHPEPSRQRSLRSYRY